MTCSCIDRKAYKITIPDLGLTISFGLFAVSSLTAAVAQTDSAYVSLCDPVIKYDAPEAIFRVAQEG